MVDWLNWGWKWVILDCSFFERRSSGNQRVSSNHETKGWGSLWKCYQAYIWEQSVSCLQWYQERSWTLLRHDEAVNFKSRIVQTKQRLWKCTQWFRKSFKVYGLRRSWVRSSIVDRHHLQPNGTKSVQLRKIPWRNHNF